MPGPRCSRLESQSDFLPLLPDPSVFRVVGTSGVGAERVAGASTALAPNLCSTVQAGQGSHATTGMAVSSHVQHRQHCRATSELAVTMLCRQQRSFPLGCPAGASCDTAAACSEKQ